MSKLAINGGPQLRTRLFPAQLTTGMEEAVAASRVIDSGVLSYFRGSWIPSFFGGEEVKKFERNWSKEFGFPDTVAVNSCTSALQVACGAIGIQPGDEVIVTPWSMSCSATAPMIWGGIPVFADIEEKYFCLDVQSVKEKITTRTKAIIVVDLFGQPFNPELIKLAEEHNLWLIEDAAQAPGATWMNPKDGQIYWTGSLGDLSCFSFTQGKHLTAGEGGAISVNIRKENKGLTLLKTKLIRNHTEAVLSSMTENEYNLLRFGKDDNINLIGFNMRMTEIQAAILNEQIKKLSFYIAMRQSNVIQINKLLEGIPGFHSTPTRDYCTHTYYVQSFFYNQEEMEGIPRDKFIEAVRAELCGEERRVDRGVPIGCGYIKPLYFMPLFKKRQHWSIKERDYTWECCPVAEKLWKDTLVTSMYHGLPLLPEDLQDYTDAYHKVWENREELK